MSRRQGQEAGCRGGGAYLEQSEELRQHGAIAHVRGEGILGERGVDRTEELRRLVGGLGLGLGLGRGLGLAVGVGLGVRVGAGLGLGLGSALPPGRWLAGRARRRGRRSS